MYTCGITPVRRHPPRPRGHVPRLRRAAAPADRPRPHRDVRAQRHRRRRPAVRQGPPARRPLPRPGGGGGGPVRGATWRRSTPCPSPRRRGPPRRSPTSAASSAWCSTAASPTRPAAPCTSTSPKFEHVRLDQPLHRGGDARRWRGSAAATSTTRTSATRSTSCCGSRRRPTSRRGTRCGGPGGPGWHIECSALALRELGTTIDLHGGGTDLIFPHHECERAQSEAATGEPFVRHWMHTALIAKDGEKMSKSLGNLVFVDALRTEWDPMAIRLGDHRAPLPHGVGVGRRADAPHRPTGSRRWRGAADGRPCDVLDDGAGGPRRRSRHPGCRRRHRRRRRRGDDVRAAAELLGDRPS